VLTISHTPKGYPYIATPGGIARPCTRCNGVRRINQWQHVEGGVCFRCGGEGVEAKRFASVEAYEAHEAKRYQAQAQRQARDEAKHQAQAEAYRVEAEAEAKRQAEARQAREAESAQWSHVEGVEGDRVTVAGTVAVAVSIDTDYGTSRLIVIETPERQAVKVFTTAEWAWGVERGEAITVVGAIKAHTVYEGRPQTQLVRPKRVG
jgi:hypothetical protein